MKLSSFFPMQEMREPVKSTEFKALEKHVHQNLPLIKIADRFPSIKPLPVEHPDMVADLANQKHKFPSQMMLGDADFMMLAYRAAVAQNEQDRVSLRQDMERLEHDKAVGNRAFSEHENMKARLIEGWQQRIYMQRMFANLKVVSMDEYKSQMDRLFHKAVVRQAQDLKNFLVQAGLDSSSKLNIAVRTPSELAREVQDRHVVEEKMKSVKMFEDMRVKMAEQHASLIIAQMGTKKTS